MNSLRSSRLVFAAALGLAGLSASAAPLSFDFTDPKGVNNVQFSLDAPLESITGTGNGVSGTIVFDPQNPAATRGRIVLSVASLTVGNPIMRDHLQGKDWLAAEQHPEIVFEADGADNVRTEGGRVVADVKGRLTIKGVSRAVVLPVSFALLPDKLGARVGDPKVKGDLLVVRASFAINRSEFGIQPGQMTDKVAEQIQLSLSLAGAAPKA